MTTVTPHWIAIGIASKNPAQAQALMYSRTQNDNGTFNTRCLHCFMTVASAVESAPELDAIEARHKCPERVLAELVARAAQPAPTLHGRQPH